MPAGPGCTTPYIRFLFVTPHIRIQLPSDPTSRWMPLRASCLRLREHLTRGLAPRRKYVMSGTHGLLISQTRSVLMHLLVYARHCHLSPYTIPVVFTQSIPGVFYRRYVKYYPKATYEDVVFYIASFAFLYLDNLSDAPNMIQPSILFLRSP